MASTPSWRARILVCSTALAPCAAQADSRPVASSASSPSGTLIVLNKSDATAWLIDPRSGKRVAELPVGTGPHEVACSPDGKTAVVCNYGDQQTIGSSVTILDVARREVRGDVELAPMRRPHGIQFTARGDRVAITCETDRRLLLLDLEQSKVEARLDTRANLSHMVALAADDSRAYTANIGSGSVSVLDLTKGVLVSEVKTGRGCEGIALRPAAAELWTTNRAADTLAVVDTAKLEVTATLPCGKFPLRVAFLPDGSRALVACTNSGEVAVFDAAARKELCRVALPEGAQPAGILVAPTGTRAYVAQMARRAVAEIDTKTWKVVREIETGGVPDGMAWSRLAP